MHDESRTENDNPNSWTPTAEDVRRAITEVERARKAGMEPEENHMETLIRGAVAFIDQERKYEQAPSGITWRLERLEKVRESKMMLTRDEVLQAIVDLRTIVDLYEKTRQTPN